MFIQRYFVQNLFLDKDPVTKKLFYYTVPSTQAKKKLVIPENYKAIFNSKTITCSECPRKKNFPFLNFWIVIPPFISYIRWYKSRNRKRYVSKSSTRSVINCCRYFLSLSLYLRRSTNLMSSISFLQKSLRRYHLPMLIGSRNLIIDMYAGLTTYLTWYFDGMHPGESISCASLK